MTPLDIPMLAESHIATSNASMEAVKGSPTVQSSPRAGGVGSGKLKGWTPGSGKDLGARVFVSIFVVLCEVDDLLRRSVG